MKVLKDLAVSGSISVGQFLQSSINTDKFLVSENGVVKFRSGSQLLGDIGAAASGHTHTFASLTSKPTTLSGYGITDAVNTATTITINGTTYDLSANRSWTVTASYTETDTLASVTGRGATTTTSLTALSFIKSGGTASQFLKADGSVDSSVYLMGITSSQVTTALGYTPYNSTNPSGYTSNTGTVTSVSGTGTVSGLTLTGSVTTSGSLNLGGTLTLTSANVTSALGYTPYNSSNPSGYITSSGNISGYAMSLNGYANQTEYIILTGPANGPVIKVRYDSATANRYIDIGSKDGNGVYSEGFKIYNGGTPTWGGNTIFHAGNYTSYSPTLTGSGASGTWGINITGSAGSLSSMNISQFTNNSGYLTGITSSQVTTALGYTPYNATNPSGYITSSALSSYLPLSGGAITGTLSIKNTSSIVQAPYQSDHDFPNGAYIQTDIVVSNGEPWTCEITAFNYGNGRPTKITINAYNYGPGTYYAGYAISTGLVITGMSVFQNASGYLCLYIPSQGYWNAYNVNWYVNYRTNSSNRVTSISNSTKPTGISYENAINPTYSLDTANSVYAYNMNQYVRTTDNVSFARVDSTNYGVGNAIYFGGGNNYFNWTNGRIYSNVSIETAGSFVGTGLTINTGGTGSWGPFVVTSTSLWGDGTTQYVTIGAGGAAGIMIYNPHIVWNAGESAAIVKYGRSGGISSGAYYVAGTGASDNFFIAKNGLVNSPQLNINTSGNAAFSGNVAINNTSHYDTTQFSLDVNGGLLIKNAGKTAQLVLQNANPASGGNNGFVVHSAGGTTTGAFASIQTYYGTSIAAGTLQLQPSGGSVTIGGSTIIHAGNYTSYVPSLSATNTWTGAQNNFLGNGNTGSTNNVGLVVYSNGGASVGAQMSFHRSGYYAVNMGLDSDNVFRIGGWSASANRLQLDMSGNLTVAGNMTGTYFYGSGSIRCGDMWGGAGLYRPSGSMVFGIENSDWVFSKGAVTQAYFAGGDGNLWMRWAGDWLSNLLGAKASTGHLHDDRYFYNRGFGAGNPSENANTMPENSSAFTYSNNAPLTGCIAYFPASGYGIQLNGNYNGDEFSMRSRNGDVGSFRPWKRLLTDYNYNNYSPTLTGGNASGTWGINITGSAGSAGSVSWGNVSSKPAGWLDTTNLIADNTPGDSINLTPSGFYQNYAGAGNPTGTWFNYINVRHSNPGNGHGFQLGMSYYDSNLWFRSYQGSGSSNGWCRALSSANFTSFVDAPNAVGNGNGYYNVQNWLQVNGAHGMFWPGYYNFHIRPNSSSTHTQMEIIGSKNSYGGIYDNYSAVNGIMYDSGGNGGVYREANGRWYWYHHVGNNCTGISTSSTSSSYRAYIGGSLYAEGDVVAYSDVRKKTDIVTIDNALNKVLQLRGVYYTRIDNVEKGRQTGVIAQEINEVLPEVVTYAADVDEYGVAYGNIVGILIESIKAQQLQIEGLKKQIEYLVENK